MATIPCMIFRGGTSKGPYLKAEDLPQESSQRNSLLLRLMGSTSLENYGQIDGIGGGQFVTSKVAIVSPSSRKSIDVDYRFVQVMPNSPETDDKPTCGNMLSAVGAFALETGMVKPTSPESEVSIFDVNTGATIRQIIQTPKRKVTYDGSFSIAGVPGTGSPIEMFFKQISGGKTGHYMPTGNPVDVFAQVEATCLDISMPTVFIEAQALGVSGYETPQTLNVNATMLKHLLDIREKASHAMGMGSAKGNVIPKVALISAPRNGGDISVRYFTPKTCHPSVAVSAGFCIATGCFIKDTLLSRLAGRQMEKGNNAINIENPSGITETNVAFPDGSIENVEGTTTRTARLLFSGQAHF